MILVENVILQEKELQKKSVSLLKRVDKIEKPYFYGKR